METVWLLLASLGAGVGTGLAGLSAATVMVPVLIVLCPGFSGEYGAYQATAIALASDILGSAVAAWTYARHGNLDLRRGRIMMGCILAMCVAGSYAAWLAGNVVLGTFSLFLTAMIGLRFLLVPEKAGRQAGERAGNLTGMDIAVSVFFGLTIGFGTGFVGTGGGMMMLVVFTLFLGMDRKTAVGTSTLIMTFTAMIAAVSHVIIHPAIVLEKGGAMLLCVAAATVSSLVSARFANAVSQRTVSLVTGTVLTVLSAILLGIHYREALRSSPLPGDILRCALSLCAYLVPCVAVMLLLKRLARIPPFVFRKLLHMVAFGCSTLMIVAAPSWQAAALTACLAAAVIYPLLSAVEKAAWYPSLFVQKSPGEVKRSMLMLFLTFAAVICLAWGWQDKPWAAACAVLMWGTGDAAAALVGIPFGRHRLPVGKRKKSLEGSGAMLAVSFATGLATCAALGALPMSRAAGLTAIAAALGTLTELVSSSEADTVTVPLAILVPLLLM